MFPLRDQNFGGAQTPAPFSGRLKIIMPKWGGSGPLSPLKTCFLVSSRSTRHQAWYYEYVETDTDFGSARLYVRSTYVGLVETDTDAGSPRLYVRST
jgi:hypothetical protein